MQKIFENSQIQQTLEWSIVYFLNLIPIFSLLRSVFISALI